MSRVTPPSAGAGASGQSNPQRPQASAPGIAANKPNVTTPKAPSVGQSAPPTAGGMPANKVPVGKPGSTAAARPGAPAGAARPGAPTGAARPGAPGKPP